MKDLDKGAWPSVGIVGDDVTNDLGDGALALGLKRFLGQSSCPLLFAASTEEERSNLQSRLASTGRETKTRWNSPRTACMLRSRT